MINSLVLCPVTVAGILGEGGGGADLEGIPGSRVGMILISPPAGKSWHTLVSILSGVTPMSPDIDYRQLYISSHLGHQL